MNRSRKILVVLLMVICAVIIVEITYLYFVRTQAAYCIQAKAYDYLGKDQNPSNIYGILSVYLSSNSKMFTDGKIEAIHTGQVVEPASKDDKGFINISINTDLNNSDQDNTLKLFEKHTLFVDSLKKPISYSYIKKGDLLKVVYSYNYKNNSYNTEVIKLK